MIDSDLWTLKHPASTVNLDCVHLPASGCKNSPPFIHNTRFLLEKSPQAKAANSAFVPHDELTDFDLCIYQKFPVCYETWTMKQVQE